MAISDLFFGSYTIRNQRRIKSILSKVNSYKDSYADLNESDFKSKTNEFRQRLRNGESTTDILPEALAVCRQATKVALNMFHYDTQIEASIAMIGQVTGKNENGEDERERIIAEMKTGEGKTLVQILVAYINALEATKDENPKNWKSVHVMTSNDALAKRDASINKQVYELLGLSCGFAPSQTKSKRINDRLDNLKIKREAYMCDIVYATTSTIAFDYLNDNTIFDPKDRIINRKFGYAIIDEADDLLLDQATNPLILSGKINGVSEKTNDNKREIYKWATEFLYGKKGVRLEPLDGRVFDQYEQSKHEEFLGYIYFLDTQEVTLNSSVAREIGYDLTGKNAEEIYNLRYMALLDCIRARHSFLKNEQYEVKVDGDKADIILTDQNTGRRKYSNKYIDGMQEAIEAKEEYLENDAVGAKKRYHINQSFSLSTKAMCTYPDFLSLYDGRVCGMTGTSDIEEFKDIYGFETYEVPSRKKNIRIDSEDEVYATLNQKHKAIINEVLKCRQTLEPVLIGTTSIDESKIISSMLKKYGIRHQLLNAENEEEESKIIESAGLLGAVTVATNMAGRGTDIRLGEGASEVGGLYVIGTSKNKSTRIDRQLRGRSARQGDPGKTKYFSSLEDSLVKLYYPGDTLKGFIEMFKKSDEPIKNKSCLKAVLKAQKHKESSDKAERRTSEQFNKTFTEHKKIIYEIRNDILDAGPKEFIECIKKIIIKYSDYLVENETLDNMEVQLKNICNVRTIYSGNKEMFKEGLANAMYASFRNNFSVSGVKTKEVIKYYQDIRVKLLNVIDLYWASHFDNLEYLKKKMTIGFGINDVFKEYENEANEIFNKELMPSILNEMITYAANPNMKFGDYEITYYKENDPKEKILV